jgi:hypothetical protein
MNIIIIITITISAFSIMHNMTIQIICIVWNFIPYALGGATLSRSSSITFTLAVGGGEIKKLALHFWKCCLSCVDSKSHLLLLIKRCNLCKILACSKAFFQLSLFCAILTRNLSDFILSSVDFERWGCPSAIQHQPTISYVKVLVHLEEIWFC